MITPKKVMIIDDEPDIVGALEMALGVGKKHPCNRRFNSSPLMMYGIIIRLEGSRKASFLR
jgi:hypothetical protein